MKRLLALILLSSVALADDRMRDAQTELKRQGFYYGEVDGNVGAETTASIRRFQIRNGLEVTGELNTPTLEALNGGAEEKKQPAPPPPREPAPPPPPTVPEPREARDLDPPAHLRRDESVEESDRAFLRREAVKRQSLPDDESVVPPPRQRPEPTGDLTTFFGHTPYATAPLEVQEQTVRRAQSILAERGFYRDNIDGDAGPATEEALLAFQRSKRLQLTGRLDLPTLGELRLLPGRAPIKTFTPPAPQQRIYRGVIVE